MRRTTTTGLCLTLLAGPAFAQGAPGREAAPKTKVAAEARASSSESISGVTAPEGQTTGRSYKVVTRDGKVVEESGDKSLLRELGAHPGFPDLDELMRQVRSGLSHTGPSGSSASSSDSSSSKSSASSSERSSSSHSRRVVVKDGKTIVDEESVDGERIEPGHGDRKRPGALPRPGREAERGRSDEPRRLPPPAARPAPSRPPLVPPMRPAGKAGKNGRATRLG